jgi:hypothetical protein
MTNFWDIWLFWSSHGWTPTKRNADFFPVKWPSGSAIEELHLEDRSSCELTGTKPKQNGSEGTPPKAHISSLVR